MPSASNKKSTEKENLHPRNLHRDRYNFKDLIQSCPELRQFVTVNKYHDESIDFSDPLAVKNLNKALLKHFYGISHWDIPVGYLCPPIPGRADYIHYMADLLAVVNGGIIPAGNKVTILDIGTGANCVYPLIGNSIYGWGFVGSDVDPIAIRSAKNIIAQNPGINNAIDCRLQTNSSDIFEGVIKPGEVFDLTVCNPPFHASLKEAQAGTQTKWSNLNKSKQPKTLLNFGGKNTELWCTGGESGFINRMIEQSSIINKSCFWFSTLVSKKDTLKGLYRMLKKVKATEVKTINMAQGQKISRAVAWTFLNETEQLEWKNKRWDNN